MLSLGIISLAVVAVHETEDALTHLSTESDQKGRGYLSIQFLLAYVRGPRLELSED
jgi:hypothetical protein